MLRLRFATFVTLFMSAIHPALSEEQMTPLVESGDWVALAHRESLVASADMCGVANLKNGIIIRADKDGIEFRVVDESWSLPSSVQGKIGLLIGKENFPLDINSNSNDMVAAPLAEDVALQMFKAMDDAASMAVTVGTAKPKSVSLAGSTKATNAFRTCAGIRSSSPSGGNNPFAGNPVKGNQPSD